jgi:hypothetical protein
MLATYIFLQESPFRGIPMLPDGKTIELMAYSSTCGCAANAATTHENTSFMMSVNYGEDGRDLRLRRSSRSRELQLQRLVFPPQGIGGPSYTMAQRRSLRGQCRLLRHCRTRIVALHVPLVHWTWRLELWALS